MDEKTYQDTIDYLNAIIARQMDSLELPEQARAKIAAMPPAQAARFLDDNAQYLNPVKFLSSQEIQVARAAGLSPQQYHEAKMKYNNDPELEAKMAQIQQFITGV